MIGPFRAKYISLDLKKYRGVIFHDTEESCKIWRKTDMMNLANFHQSIQVSKICTLMSCFWPKYKMFELKKYRGVTVDGIDYWCKIWRKTDLCLLKWYEEFGKFLFIGRKITKLNDETKSKSKFKTTRSTRCSVKTLFYLGNKWIAQLAKLFTHVLQNRCA